jgi:catechol 2,3-dioxygenase-like lactoylglutathione lyase family enzyme
VTASVFDDASMAATVVRVRDVEAAIGWYSTKFGVEPIHVGDDGPEHPIAVYRIAGSVVSLWQLPAGQTRSSADNDCSSYLAVVVDRDLAPVRETLIGRGVTVSDIRRSAHHEFIWFYDLDGNRFELSRPVPARS